MSSFPHLQDRGELDRHIEHVPRSPDNAMSKLSLCSHWLVVCSSAEGYLRYTSEGPVALPALPEFKKLFIKSARFLEGS